MMFLWKTDTSEIVARHNTVRYLDRLRRLNPAWAVGAFEDCLKKRHRVHVLRVAGKEMTTAFGKMFARLLASLGLLYDIRSGEQRTM
jgi:hypothetical protein